MQKLDILVISAHPDDAELCCGGTVAAHIAAGKKVGFVDLTRGELGTRGTPEIRLQEAEDAARILGLSLRDNLGMRDGFFKIDEDHLLQVVQKIRQYRPDILLTNAIGDRHPDHGRAAQLVKEAFFLAGLRKIETRQEGAAQEAWRPAHLYHFIQSNYLQPDFVVDVSAHWDTKMAAVKAFKSQFHDPNSQEPETFISSDRFMQFIDSRGREWGHAIGVTHGEGFLVSKQIGIKSLFDLL
jgi:N-acetylglucosamine malate deacetylase 1